MHKNILIKMIILKNKEERQVLEQCEDHILVEHPSMKTIVEKLAERSVISGKKSASEKLEEIIMLFKGRRIFKLIINNFEYSDVRTVKVLEQLIKAEVLDSLILLVYDFKACLRNNKVRLFLKKFRVPVEYKGKEVIGTEVKVAEYESLTPIFFAILFVLMLWINPHYTLHILLLYVTYRIFMASLTGRL